MLARSTITSAAERISSVSLIDPASAPFELRAGPYESPALAVLSVRGREAISELFSFEITVAASSDVDDSTIEPDLLGASACLVMQAGASGPRFVRGVIAAVAAQSAVHGRRAVYRLRVVPALWLLKKQTTSRIFQDKTVPEIVTAVLDKAGVTHALRLLGKYRPRTYCVQHRETNFAFVERLLAEEGIFYTFDHGGPDADAEIVSLSDSAHLYPAIEGEPELAYRPHEGAAGMALDEHHVQRFELRRSLRPTSVLRRGYDFRRPALNLVAEEKLKDLSSGEPKRGEIYEHHEEDEEPNIRQETVNAELEQHRAGVEVAHGSSGCRRLVTGARFRLCDHDLGRLDAEYVVTSVMHEGRSPETATQGEPVYANTFECVPATIAARPPRPERSLQQVTETAIVVGPEGQEIYTDEYGRVKVQFHWDREGQRDERSSCWIRVAQAWAGSGWGFEFIPRVGMEVIVTFLGGDVDRPLITGCVPNAINRPVFALPSNKTQSGIRTQSTPGGGGYNEFSFEDKKNSEQILLRAQRNFDEEVLGDHATYVGKDRRSTVKGNVQQEVGGDLATRGRGDRIEDIGGDSTAVIGKRLTSVIGGDNAIDVAGDASLRVRGGQTVVVQGNMQTLVGHGAKESHALLCVNGAYNIAVSQKLSISANQGITFICGDSSIELSPEGVKIKGKTISIGGTDSVFFTVKGHEIRMGDALELVSDKICLSSTNASLVMEDDVNIDGRMVKINCKPKPLDLSVQTPSDPEEGIATFEIKNRVTGEPKVGVTLLIATPAGEVIERQTNSDGKVEIQGKKGEHFIVVGVKDGDHALGMHGNSA